MESFGDRPVVVRHATRSQKRLAHTRMRNHSPPRTYSPTVVRQEEKLAIGASEKKHRDG
jgi:hypothetical protein